VLAALRANHQSQMVKRIKLEKAFEFRATLLMGKGLQQLKEYAVQSQQDRAKI
jgi:hypothetical protein